MTSPYVYPREGLGAALPKAVGKVLGDNGGALELGVPLEGLVLDDAGRCVGVRAGGESVAADCVVAGADHVPEHASEAHKVVRLFAVLNHPPQMCKDARSCQLLLPAAQVGRESDAYLFSATSTQPRRAGRLLARRRLGEGRGRHRRPQCDAGGEARAQGSSAPAARRSRCRAQAPVAEMTTVSEASDGLPAGLHVLSTGGAESHLSRPPTTSEKCTRRSPGSTAFFPLCFDELIDDY